MVSSLIILLAGAIIVFLVALGIFCSVVFRIKDSWDSQWFLMKATNEIQARQTAFVVITYTFIAAWVVFATYWVLFPW